MRRAILATSLAVLAAAPAAAQAAQSARLDVAATLLNQPVGRPWAIDLGVSTTVSTPDGSPPSPLRSIDLSFPHATLNDGRFPTCTLKRLQVKGSRACPKASRIGTGTAIADVRPLLDIPVHAGITVYNGPRQGGARTLLFDSIAKEVQVRFILVGHLRHTGGRFGYRLTMQVPPLNTIPGAKPAAISRFDVTVGGRRHGRSFLEAPRSCPRGGLPFQGRFTFADGSKASAKAAISCTLRASSAG